MKSITLLGLLGLILVLMTGLFPGTTSMAAGGPSLQVALSPDTPGSRNVMVGSNEVIALEATFTAGPYETRTDNLTVRAYSSKNGTISPLPDINLCNIKLYEKTTTGKTIIADPISSIGSAAKFCSVNWTIPKETSKNLGVIVDIPSGASVVNFFIAIDGKDVEATAIATGTKVPVSGSANGTVMKIVPCGSLTVSLAPDTPPARIVAVGTATGAVGENKTKETAVKIDLTPVGEAVAIDSVTVQRIDGNDADFGAISLWDVSSSNATQIGTDRYLINYGGNTSNTSFMLPPDKTWFIPNGVTKTLDVRAELNGIKTENVSGSTSGDTPKLSITRISGVGANSGQIITVSTNISGNEMVLRKSKPIVAATSLPTYALHAGDNTFYREVTTADQKGNVGWKTKVFEMTGEIYVGQDTFVIGSKTENVTDAIYMQTANGTLQKLINAASLRMINLQTGESVNGTFLIWHFPNKVLVHYAATSPQTIVAGNTTAYELRGDVLYGKGLIMTKIPEGRDIPDNPYIDSASFTWTDGVAWTTDYLVPGIPTMTLSLTNGEPPTQPSITVLSPNGGETFTSGGQMPIAFSLAGVPAGTHFDVYLISPSNQEWYIVTGETTSSNIQNTGLTLPTGSYAFSPGCYKIRVSLMVGGAIIQDSSDSYFCIFPLRGDVNGDGKVNALDITALERIIAGLD